MNYDRAYAERELGADCSHCPLRTVGKFVPSVGPSRADIAFVGEAPGRQEAREGIPFTGPSGRLLDAVNQNYGIRREEVFLTNATLCRPPDNSTPVKQAVAACRPRLHRELLERGSRKVVALGNTAALALLGVEGVTKLRVGPGRRSPYEALGELTIIPTVHPAACLRQSDMFPSLVADVAKVVTDHVPWNTPQWRVLDDPLDAIAYLRDLEARADELVLDIEVDVDKDTGFDHPDRYGLLCIGFCDEREEPVVVGERALRDERVLDALADALDACKLDAQNGKFDLAGLFPLVGAQELYFDTMLAHYCLDERPGVHGLKHMAVEYLGAPQYDEEIAKYVKGVTDEDLSEYKGYGRIPRDILYEYNAYDVVATWRLRKKFVPMLEAGKQPEWWDEFANYPFKNLRELHDFLVMVSNEMMYIELNGIKLDRKYQDELWEKYSKRMEELEAEINDLLVKDGWFKINPRSPQQVKKLLQEHFRVRTDSTNADTLKLINEQMFARYADEAYNKSLYNFCDLLLKYRKEAKMFGTYVKGLRQRTYKGRVYTTFRLNGPVTGRTASRNPNIQNVPRDPLIKKQFIPGKEGNVFVQADYAQAELRVLAWLAQCDYFRDILNDDDRDLFDELTPQLYPSLGDKATVDPVLWKDVRVRVKAFVYGLNYGRTAEGIAQEYRMPAAEARMMRDNFFQVIPEIVDWQKMVQNHVKRGRDLISPFGRHRRFHLVTNENWDNIKKEALAFLPQSTSSDVGLRALTHVRRDLRGSGAFVRNFVHDSILVDCPADMARDVASLLDRRMVESGQELVGDYIKFKTDCKIGSHWGEV